VVAINLYQPNKVNTSINFPTEWNELLLQELHSIAQSILLNFKMPSAAQAMVFLSLFKHRCKQQGLPADYLKKLDAEDCAINGMPLTEFIYTANNLTRQPYPILPLAINNCPLVPKKEMTGPEDDFNNITCGEFEDAEIFYHQFKAEPKPEALAHLASILYRVSGDKYLQFNAADGTYTHYNADKLYPKFLKLQPWVLFTIYLWYVGCKEQLPKLFPNVFSSAGSSDAEPDMMVFTKCIHAAAGAKNGSRSQVRLTLLKELLYEIELETIKAKELQALYDK
jgi:hypothetical protein